MKTIQSQSTSNPCSIAQYAATTALGGGKEIIAQRCAEFYKRHQYVYQRLNDIQDIHVIPADGTFYIFPSVQSVIEARGFKNDMTFSEQLLLKTGLAIVPGSAFGTEGCIRLSFATDMATLQDAMNRLEQFVSSKD
jgi:aspartate aminotransferase